MAKIEFNSSNKVKSFNDYPKLKFEQKGEKARIVVLDDAPEAEWVHTLRAPSIVNGQVVMETVKNNDGGTSEKPKMDFIGQHICFGNPNVLAENAKKGNPKDPQNCPTCAASNESEAIDGPKRRFAMHIVRYKTQPGSYKVQEPFQAELLAWTFTDKVFDTLVNIAEEHGDLRSKDLLLECSNKFFQNVEIQVGGSAAWTASDETKQFVARLFAENKSEDLTSIIARKASREQAMEDIAKVKLKHAQAFGGTTEGAGPAPSGSQTESSLNLDDILSGGSGSSEPEATPAAPAQTFESAPTAVVEEAETPASAPQATETVEEEKPAESGGGDVLDFDSLLKGL